MTSEHRDENFIVACKPTRVIFSWKPCLVSETRARAEEEGQEHRYIVYVWQMVDKGGFIRHIIVGHIFHITSHIYVRVISRPIIYKLSRVFPIKCLLIKLQHRVLLAAIVTRILYHYHKT